MVLTGTGGNVTVNTLDSVNGTSARSITLTGALSGAGGLTKTGEGNLVLSGGGTFAGTATSTGGSLFLGTTAWTNASVASSAGGVIQPGTLATSGTSTVAALNFNEGKRYADFNASTDKVAEYGLAALVAGVAAKKLGRPVKWIGERSEEFVSGAQGRDIARRRWLAGPDDVSVRVGHAEAQRQLVAGADLRDAEPVAGLVVVGVTVRRGENLADAGERARRLAQHGTAGRQHAQADGAGFEGEIHQRGTTEDTESTEGKRESVM